MIMLLLAFNSLSCCSNSVMLLSCFPFNVSICCNRFQFRVCIRILYSAPACAFINFQSCCNNLMTTVLHYKISRSILDILSWDVIIGIRAGRFIRAWGH